MLSPGILNTGKELNYALGLIVRDYKGLKMISHGGAFVGFRAEMIRFPEQRFSVIVLANLSTINPSKLARQVADIYLSDKFKEKPLKAREKKPAFIKLSEAELKEKEGTYYNKKRDSVWKIYLEEGKLMVNTSTFRFQISPISQSRFLAIEAPVEMEIEFVRESPEEPMRLLVDTGEEEPLIFESFQAASPSVSELKEYLGDYYSQELQVTYSVVMEKGRLFLRHENPYKGDPTTPLEPTFRDRFLIHGIHLAFFRNEEGRIVSFTMNADRVRNIRFDRK